MEFAHRFAAHSSFHGYFNWLCRFVSLINEDHLIVFLVVHVLDLNLSGFTTIVNIDQLNEMVLVQHLDSVGGEKVTFVKLEGVHEFITLAVLVVRECIEVESRNWLRVIRL